MNFPIIIIFILYLTRILLKFVYFFNMNYVVVCTNASGTWNIKNLCKADTTNERSVRFWFARSRSGNFKMDNEPRGRPQLKVNNEELRTIVEPVHRKL